MKSKIIPEEDLKKLEEQFPSLIDLSEEHEEIPRKLTPEEEAVKNSGSRGASFIDFLGGPQTTNPPEENTDTLIVNIPPSQPSLVLVGNLELGSETFPLYERNNNGQLYYETTTLGGSRSRKRIPIKILVNRYFMTGDTINIPEFENKIFTIRINDRKPFNPIQEAS